jgi:hypothetical protein
MVRSLFAPWECIDIANYGPPRATGGDALQSLGQILGTIGTCSAVGVFIDFYIGKSGQRRVKDRLETWWIKFSDIRWDTIGRAESEFAIHFMDRFFGKRLISIKRWLVVSITTIVITGYVVVGGLMLADPADLGKH